MERKQRWSASEVKEFCGWDFLQKMVEQARLTRLKVLICAGFLTGGRIAEVLKLECGHFDFVIDPKYVVVRTMPVLKRYKKIGSKTKFKCEGHCTMRWGVKGTPDEPTAADRARHNIVEYQGWETKEREVYRTFPFPNNEPLVPILRDLLPQEGPLFDIRYNTAYNEMVELGKEMGTWLPPHWLRAQRASQLAFEYGFNEHDLVTWFIWKDYMTAFNYARKGFQDLAKKMVRALH